MKPTEHREHSPPAYGLKANGRKAKTLFDGELTDLPCRVCGRLVLAPSDCLVTCGRCLFREVLSHDS